METAAADKPRATERALFWGGLAVVLALFGFRCWMFWALTVDDAYITMRHARNLVEGHGFVYNIGGPRVESYTNHLLFLLQALVLLLKLDPIVYTKLIGAAAGVATILGAVRLAILLGHWQESTVAPPLAILSGAWLLADSPILATGAVAGLETALFTALVTWSAILMLQLDEEEHGWRFAVLAGVVMGLGTWTRPEGIAWSGGLAVACAALAVYRRRSVRMILLAGGIAAGFWIVLTLYRLQVFGHPQPNSYYVKMSGGAWSRTLSGLQYLRDWGVLNGGLVLLAVAIAGVFLSKPAARWAVLIALLAVAGHLALTAYEGGDWMPHLRLVCPCVGVLAALFSHGLVQVVRRFSGRSAMVAGVLLPLVVCAGFSAGLQKELRRAMGEVQVRVYGWADGHKALALWIAGWEQARTQAGEAPLTVALTDIGLVGYHSDVRVIDLAGLADPDWAQFAYTTGRIYDYQAGLLVMDRNPEIIVLVTQTPPGAPQMIMDWHTNKAVYDHPDFAPRYRYLTTFTHKDFPGDGYFLNVYLRKDVVASAPPANPPVARARNKG
jgi:arabinofuranosyltransferase